MIKPSCRDYASSSFFYLLVAILVFSVLYSGFIAEDLLLEDESSKDEPCLITDCCYPTIE